MSEFTNLNDAEVEEVRAQVHEYNHPTAEAPVEDKAQLAADTLRVKHVMTLRTGEETPDDRAFLRAQIQAALKTL